MKNMVPKWFMWFLILIGSAAGAYAPMIWGVGGFSFSSVIFSGIGGFLGIWIALKIGNSL